MGSPGSLDRPKLLRVGFFIDDHLDVRGDFPMQADRDQEFAQRFQRLFQLHLAAVNLEALGFERLRDMRPLDGAS